MKIINFDVACKSCRSELTRKGATFFYYYTRSHTHTLRHTPLVQSRSKQFAEYNTQSVVGPTCPARVSAYLLHSSAPRGQLANPVILHCFFASLHHTHTHKHTHTGQTNTGAESQSDSHRQTEASSSCILAFSCSFMCYHISTPTIDEYSPLVVTELM